METNKTLKGDYYKIDPRNIVVKEGFNSRVDFDLEPLKQSIKENGVLNPVTVVKFNDEEGNEKYRLVDGERRYRSVMELLEEGVEIARVPAIAVPKTTEADLLLQQVLRNEGKPFNEYELGIVCRKFEQFGFSRSEIAKKLNKDSGCITYYLQHLDRDENVQELLKTNQISGATVRRVYANNDGDEKESVKKIIEGKKVADSKQKKVITVKDIDMNGKGKVKKDSNTIREGLTLLFEYYNKHVCDAGLGDVGLNLDISDILKSLNTNKTIDDIMSEAVKTTLAELKEQERQAI